MHPHKKEKGHKSLGVKVNHLKRLKAKVAAKVEKDSMLTWIILGASAFLAGTIWGVVISIK